MRQLIYFDPIFPVQSFLGLRRPERKQSKTLNIYVNH
jgi:hypothetical protein